jgi:predicted transcriptional regulator of viral defense system
LTDQIFRPTVVATTSRVRRVTQRVAGNEYLVHHVAPELLGWGLRTEWRDERKVMVADPARTVMELLGDPALGGGIRHVAEILENYLDGNDPAALIEAGDRLGNGAAFKRLGYILEESDRALPELISACRERVTPGVSALDPTQRSSGPRAPRWHLRANVDLSSAS